MRRGHLTVAARGFLITQTRKAKEKGGNYSFLIKDSGQLTKEEAIQWMENEGFSTSIEAVDDGVMIKLSLSSKEEETNA